MHAGTDTGSLTNHLMSRQVLGEPAPQLNTGCTLLSWTDRYAGTIVEMFKVGKTQYIVVQEDKAIRTDKNGMSEAQEYLYEQDTKGPKYTFRKDGKGFWAQVTLNKETGRYNMYRGYGLKIGHRNAYHDYSF